MKHRRLSLVLFSWILLGSLVLFYAVWMSDQAVLRYNTFVATAFDLGNMDQAVWNTLHGRPFQFTNHGSNWYGYPIRLAQHVEPIIFLLSLLYVFHADPRILLIFQTLMLAAGALPVFLLTRKFVSVWPLLAPVMAAAYLFSPAVIGENIFDFHPVVLVTPLLLYAILALTSRHYVWFVLCCVLAAACKEEIPIVIALLGLLVIWKYKLPRLGILLFVGGMSWSTLAFAVIEPHFNIGAHSNTFWYRYAVLGSSPKAAIVNILLHPWILFSTYFTLNRVYYLINLVRSAGFLALLGPEWLLPTLFSVAINILSMEAFGYSGVYQYNAAIIPFVIIASIHGIRRFLLLWYNWRGEWKQRELLRESAVLIVADQKTFRIDKYHNIFFCTNYMFTIFYAIFLNYANRQVLFVRLRFHMIKLLERLHARGRDLAQWLPISLLQACALLWIVGMIALNYFVMLPWLNVFWAKHQPGYREQRIEDLLAKIPADAPVSADGNLNPHLTERQYVTVFPELTIARMTVGKSIPVQYVIVDLYDVSPEDQSRSAIFLSTLNWLERSQQFRIVGQAEGVILLKRN